MSGSQCCENPPSLSCLGASGSVEEIGGLKAYITGSSQSNIAIILISDVFELRAPIAILGAEVDHISPPALLKQFEEVLSKINGYAKIFPGAAHGWTVRYKDEDEKAVKCTEEAHQNMLSWFAEYVK